MGFGYRAARGVLPTKADLQIKERQSLKDSGSSTGSFPAAGRAAKRHLVVVGLFVVVPPGRTRKFGKVRSLSCIFHLTASRTCDSLPWWSYSGHIVAGRPQDAPGRKAKRNEPGYGGIQRNTKNEK